MSMAGRIDGYNDWYRAVSPLRSFIYFENYRPPRYLYWGNIWLNLDQLQYPPNVIPRSARWVQDMHFSWEKKTKQNATTNNNCAVNCCFLKTHIFFPFCQVERRQQPLQATARPTKEQSGRKKKSSVHTLKRTMMFLECRFYRGCYDCHYRKTCIAHLYIPSYFAAVRSKYYNHQLPTVTVVITAVFILWRWPDIFVTIKAILSFSV